MDSNKAKETKALIPQETIAKVKAERGAGGLELHVLEAAGNAVIVRTPSSGIWDAFQEARDKVGTRALRQLLCDCVVYPESAEVLGMLDRRPALANVFGAKLLELAGLEEEAKAKKA